MLGLVSIEEDSLHISTERIVSAARRLPNSVLQYRMSKRILRTWNPHQIKETHIVQEAYYLDGENCPKADENGVSFYANKAEAFTHAVCTNCRLTKLSIS